MPRKRDNSRVKATIRRWTDRLAAAGALPGDPPEERLRKATLMLSSIGVTILATVWVATYAALGLWVSAAVPLAYQVLSLLDIAVFLRTRRWTLFRFLQLLLILLLPFILQWTLGGFVNSGAVMLWAIVAPLGALFFCGPRLAVPWLGAYIALIGLSGAIDGVLPRHHVPTAAVVAFFALNTSVVSAFAYSLIHYFLGEREKAMAALAEEHSKLVEEQARSERLLLNILPEPIADRLKAGETVIADRHEEVSVLFADIAGFTPLAEGMEPEEVVRLLNTIFSAFDELAEAHGLEKIKTIGDGYMAVAGLPTPRSDHAEAAAEMALGLRERIAEVEAAARCRLAVRLGIDSGPVVAGVIGKRKFSYDLWGDTVNTASRMESHASPGSIQVSERSYERLRHRYLLEPQTVVVKGKGEMTTYLLSGRSPRT